MATTTELDGAFSLDEAAQRLDHMSKQIDDAMALLGDMTQGAEEEEEEAEEEEVEEAEGAGERFISNADLDRLAQRSDDVTSALANELKITDELLKLSCELRVENSERLGDVERAIGELQDIRSAFTMLTQGRHGLFQEEEDAARCSHETDDNEADDDDDDDYYGEAPTEADYAAATPDEEETAKMELLLNKMKSQALLVEQQQLLAQLTDLEDLKRYCDIDRRPRGVVEEVLDAD